MKRTFALITIVLCICIALCSCGSEAGKTDSENSINPTNLSFKDSAEALKNGQVEAFFCTAGEPTTAVTELSTTNSINLLEIDDEHADKLIKDYPFYTKHTITKDTYKGVSKDVQTVAVKATLIASDKMDVDTVYNITKTLFEAKDEFTHDKASYIDLEYAVSGLGGVPVHPGAAKYFEEKGFTAEKYGYVVAEASADAKAIKDVRFATGGDSGTYYAFGGILANTISAKTGLSIVAQTSGGSKANMFSIEDGEADIAWVQNDVMYYGYTGTDLFESEGKVAGFSVIAAVYPETCQIVSNADIASIDALVGKSVSIGDAGSGVEFNAKQILAAYGIK